MPFQDTYNKINENFNQLDQNLDVHEAEKDKITQQDIEKLVVDTGMEKTEFLNRLKDNILPNLNEQKIIISQSLKESGISSVDLTKGEILVEKISNYITQINSLLGESNAGNTGGKKPQSGGMKERGEIPPMGGRIPQNTQEGFSFNTGVQMQGGNKIIQNQASITHTTSSGAVNSFGIQVQNSLSGEEGGKSSSVSLGFTRNTGDTEKLRDKQSQRHTEEIKRQINQQTAINIKEAEAAGITGEHIEGLQVDLEDLQASYEKRKQVNPESNRANWTQTQKNENKKYRQDIRKIQDKIKSLEQGKQ